MDIKQVTETIAMIEEQNFDVRTITMGISLLDCIDPDIEKAAEKVYNKIVTKAKDLVAVGDEIAAELGIPIVNKRVSVTPISIIGAATNATDYVPLLRHWIVRPKKLGSTLSVASQLWFKKATKKGMKSSLIPFLAPLQRRILSALQSILDRPRRGSI